MTPAASSAQQVACYWRWHDRAGYHCMIHFDSLLRDPRHMACVVTTKSGKKQTLRWELLPDRLIVSAHEPLRDFNFSCEAIQP